MMRQTALVFVLLCSTLSFYGQVECLNSEQKFGKVNRDTERVVDLIFVNRGPELAYLLTHRFPREFAILPAKRQVEQGDSLVIRFKFNPLKKGRYQTTVPISFSTQNDPINIRITADVDFVDRTENPSCPSFEVQAMANSDQNKVSFEVLNIKTGSPIKNAFIRTVDRGEVIGKFKTDKAGRTEAQVPISYYYMIAEATGYTMADTVSYINRRHNFFRFYLDPLAIEEEPKVVIEPEPKPDIVIVINEPQPNEEEEEIAITEDLYPEFSSNQFAPNNIVFLIDVSGSMATKGKMDLLKASMIALLDMLRPIDQLTIITYASRVSVVLSTTSIANKGEIKEIIRNLEARGATAGALGVKKAFKVAKKEMIPGGNNQVIIATDGAFKNADNPIIEKTVKKYQRKRIDLSVLGIRSSNYVAKKLSELATTGNGAYLPVDDLDQASSTLVDEIRRQSQIQK